MREENEKVNQNNNTPPASVEMVAEKVYSRDTGPVKGKDERWIQNEWLAAIGSFILLAAGLLFDTFTRPEWFSGSIRFVWYVIAYLPVGLPVVFKGVKLAFRGSIFTEFLLMGIATMGAFYIGVYPEGVAVMLFYAVGELFQGAAVNRAKRSIKALMDGRPESASVLRNGNYVSVDPLGVQVDETIQIRVGERVSLDGQMLSDGSAFNAAALTGESRPMFIERGETVLAGMINESKVVDLKVTKPFNESALARILSLLQNAQGRKAKTELFIRRFAKVYTPIVVFLAVGLTFLPYFFVEDYNFNQWLYRALIFLVISCPCALVVAIPLGYFGGIGAGSRNGILFKGSSYLDRITRVDTVVMDKTGTLTKGVFKVQQVVNKSLHENGWLSYVAALESQSNHPIAKAIIEYVSKDPVKKVAHLEEIKGYGLKGIVEGKEILAGNVKLLKKFDVPMESELETLIDTLVVVAVNRTLAGYIVIADEIKEDSRLAIRQMHAMNIKTIMLSGDKQAVVDKVARELNIDAAYGDLFPEDKVKKLEEIKKGKKEAVAFVGDGINDAPVLAISDVGIAMGGLGSDLAIETADVVIQTDQPSKIVTAIRIGKATNNIVWQNIALAFGVKVIVMALGAWGLASMWEAVFADVGVALLAIVNAIRIQRMKF
ncbi:heavy metal translocating P-type ATPase [Chryseolinea sp. H1M3-3]|uniref:heavy metal translocating P-type ATPase n=1 Tax=Chryseolinea sp. H1M3-3 TaxID=3034144 RepID=UPI0023EAE527|nr:heavy metal translocating P-type ATPase [Chryseolinea sp. H1M3-3]